MHVKKISLFVHDLAANPIGRAYPIAKALKKIGLEVEIIGFLISGDNVYAPYNDTFSFLTMPASSRPSVVLRAPELARMATGDIIYAFKPLWTSYWPALLASGFGRKKPLLLDIEDNEFSSRSRGPVDFVLNNFVRGWNFISAPKYNILLHPFTRLARCKTVSTTALKRIYGGEIILHGPDEALFDPARIECAKDACRKKFNLPESSPLLLFIGSPYPHKGLRTVIEALANPLLKSCHLVLCGDQAHPEYILARDVLKERCHIIGYLPNNLTPELLAAGDIIPVLQDSGNFANCQIPVKMLDAMALGKVIIATAVSDLPQIIGEGSCARGWIIPPLDKEAFVKAVLEAVNNPAEVERRGKTARRYFLDNASLSANADKLRSIINKLNIYV